MRKKYHIALIPLHSTKATNERNANKGYFYNKETQ